MLVQWATEHGRHSLMDPSYGGCAVLREAVEHLGSLVSDAPARVYGADVDTDTASWAAHLISLGVPPKNLVSSDFLSLRPDRELPRVDAVVGNPPYVRHQALSAKSRTAARLSAEAAGIRLGGRASLWAYFVVHASQFVAPGGRMALLLPGAVFQAEYATAVVQHLCASFGSIELVRIRERLFADAEEETVVLLADEAGGAWRSQESGPTVTTVDDLDALKAHLLAISRIPVAAGRKALQPRPFLPSRPGLSAVQPWKLQALPSGCIELFTEILAHASVTTLDQVATVRLGTVTGANEFFVLTDAEAHDLRVFEHTIGAVTRSAELRNPTLDTPWPGKRLLVLPRDMHVDGRTRLGRRITAGVRAGYPLRHHCQRAPWWALPNPGVPEAFLGCMGGDARGLVLNDAGVASTNAVHQVRWTDLAAPEHRSLGAWSTWSSLGRLAAELYGRHYGGGVLKLEIGDARRLPYVMAASLEPELVAQAAQSLQLVKDGQAIVDRADHSILRLLLGLSRRDVELLRTGAANLARLRKPPRNQREWADVQVAAPER